MRWSFRSYFISDFERWIFGVVIALSKILCPKTYCIGYLFFGLSLSLSKILTMAKSVAAVVVVVRSFLLCLLSSLIAAAQFAATPTGIPSLRPRLPNDTLCNHLILPAGYPCSEHTVSLSLSLISFYFQKLYFFVFTNFSNLWPCELWRFSWQKCLLTFSHFNYRFKQRMVTYWPFIACLLVLGI